MGRTSDKQEKILEFLNEYVEQNGYAPSVREICAAVGLKSTATVSYHLNELKRIGRIEGDSTKRRAIKLPERRETGRIPVVGVVTAGVPILAVENVEGSIVWDGDPSCFALRIKGDSMEGAGILNGDMVVVRPQTDADHGDIVIALLEDEATCKRLSKRNGIWFMPENPKYEPIDGSNGAIIGKVKAVIRKYQ